VTWGAEAAAKLAGRPPTSERHDQVDKFLSARNAPAPASCPVAPLGGSPSGAFLDGAAGTFL
jgi:hypothetical protein